MIENVLTKMKKLLALKTRYSPQFLITISLSLKLNYKNKTLLSYFDLFNREFFNQYSIMNLKFSMVKLKR